MKPPVSMLNASSNWAANCGSLWDDSGTFSFSVRGICSVPIQHVENHANYNMLIMYLLWGENVTRNYTCSNTYFGVAAQRLFVFTAMIMFDVPCLVMVGIFSRTSTILQANRLRNFFINANINITNVLFLP